jgi:hypothetical protein
LIGQINNKVFEAFFTTAAGPKPNSATASGSGFALGPPTGGTIWPANAQFDTFLVGSIKEFWRRAGPRAIPAYRRTPVRCGIAARCANSRP